MKAGVAEQLEVREPVERTKRVLADRYELHAVLGRGGMATVYRGTDRVLGRTVAVKIPLDRFAADGDFVARFRQEARAAAGLNHPNIVAVFDTGADGETHFIVMEYVPGRTLAEALATESPYAVERAIEIGESVAQALQAAHDQGLVHRDVKPGNIMLTPTGTVKVMDFGIARATADDRHTDFLLGTASYLSPEQANGDDLDARSDLYSLGCVLYEMLTGRPPFTGGSPVAIAYKHVREDPLPPSRLRPGLTREVDAVVLRALAKDPAQRFSRAADMSDALSRAIGREISAAQEKTVLMRPLVGRIGGWPGAAWPVWATPRRLIALLGGALIVGLLLMSLPPRGAAPGVASGLTPTPVAPQQTSAPPSSVAEAAANARQAVNAGLTQRDISSRAANEVLKQVDEAMEKLAEGKAGEAIKKVGEARGKLSEFTEKGEVAAARSTAIREALDGLTAALERRL